MTPPYFPTWTTIATRPRLPKSSRLLVWTELPESPLTLQEAHAMEDAGLLLMATRNRPSVAECVVMTPRSDVAAQCSFRHDGKKAVKYQPTTAVMDKHRRQYSRRGAVATKP